MDDIWMIGTGGFNEEMMISKQRHCTGILCSAGLKAPISVGDWEIHESEMSAYLYDQVTCKWGFNHHLMVVMMMFVHDIQ